MENGEVSKMDIFSEKGGEIILENPFSEAEFFCNKEFEKVGQFKKLNLAKGEKVVFNR